MANPLYKELNGTPQNPPADGGFSGMIQQFRQYATGYQGDPTQELQKMLSSGQMNQQQYNFLWNAAQKIVPMLPH